LEDFRNAKNYETELEDIESILKFKDLISPIPKNIKNILKLRKENFLSNHSLAEYKEQIRKDENRLWSYCEIKMDKEDIDEIEVFLNYLELIRSLSNLSKYDEKIIEELFNEK